MSNELETAAWRWTWAVLGVIALVIATPLVSQCTPVPGCFNDRKLYNEGSHFGFQIGMSADAAFDVVKQRYDLARADVVDGGNFGQPSRPLSRTELTARRLPLAYWWVPHRPPLCWSNERDLRLTFRDGILTAILDDPSITLP